MCTAEGRIRTKFPPRRPKRPETRGRAPQKGASGQNSRPDGPNDQKREGVHRRSAHHGNIPDFFLKNPIVKKKKTTDF
jgi:hypothetical protein